MLIQYVIATYRGLLYAMGITAIATIAVVVGAQVISRYFFDASFQWAGELSRYLLVWVSFLFAGLALERGEMVAIDFLARAVSGKLRVALLLLGAVPAVYVLYHVTMQGYQYALLNAIQSSPTLGISMFYVYLAVPVGLALMGVHFCALVAREVIHSLFEDH